MKKKIIALVLAASCALPLAACGSSSSTSDTADETTAAESETTDTTAEEETEKTDAGDTAAGDAIVIGVTSVVNSIDPTNNGSPWSLTADGIAEKIYNLDEEGNLYSRLAASLEQQDELTWILTLNEGMKFSDGSDVDAQAIADCINDIMANNEMATASAGVITAAAKDDLTVELVTEWETAVMDSVLCEWTNVVYKTADDGSYVFTGPYMVESLDPGISISMVPNPYYDEQAENRPDVTMMAFADGTAMQQAFEAEEIDMAFTVTPETAEVLEGEGYTVKNIDAGYQYFAMTNGDGDGAMGDADVRQAVNLALNREDMITALKGGRVATGFFASYYDFAGTVELTTDAEQAKTLLAEAGYEDSDGDGYLDKDGENLSITMVTYASRPDLSILMQLAADELDAVGIEVSTSIVDNIDTYLSENEDWDLAFYAQHTAPTGEPVYALSQFFRTDAAKNHGGFSNDELDALLDEMGTLKAGDEKNELARQVQDIVAEELPIIYLVDPQWNIAVSDALESYQPYCGDYYVVNDKLGLE